MTIDAHMCLGIIGAVLAVANGIGPFIGGAVIERATWRWVFWIVPMLAIPAALVIWFALPLRYDSGNHMEKVKKIDFGGILLSLASALLILVRLSVHPHTSTPTTSQLLTPSRSLFPEEASVMLGTLLPSSPCSS